VLQVAVSVLCDQVMYAFPYIMSAFAIYLSHVFLDMDDAIDTTVSNFGNIIPNKDSQIVAIYLIADYFSTCALKQTDKS
jgi:hypothetical protein